MSVSDPIADALTKIRNAYRAGHTHVVLNHSRLLENIVKILTEESYMNNYQVLEKDPDQRINYRRIHVNLALYQYRRSRLKRYSEDIQTRSPCICKSR